MCERLKWSHQSERRDCKLKMNSSYSEVEHSKAAVLRSTEQRLDASPI